jgi:hypothetical protein
MTTERCNPPTAESVVREFWRLMATNNFTSVESILGQGFVCEWPQSNERIRGADKYAQLNAQYPANGPWRFRINRLVAAPAEVVTHVSIDDGVQHAEAISFFSITDGKVSKLVEYWPEKYAAPENRRYLTESIS